MKREPHHHHFVVEYRRLLDIHDSVLLPELFQASVIKSLLKFCVSQIQLNFQKSDYDINREVMELAKVNLDEKNLSWIHGT